MDARWFLIVQGTFAPLVALPERPPRRACRYGRRRRASDGSVLIPTLHERALEPQPHKVSGEEKVDTIPITETIDFDLPERVTRECITRAADREGLEAKRVVGSGHLVQGIWTHGSPRLAW